MVEREDKMTKKEKKARQERNEELAFKYQIVNDFIKTLVRFRGDAPTLFEETVDVKIIKAAVQDLENLKDLISYPLTSPN